MTPARIALVGSGLQPEVVFGVGDLLVEFGRFKDSDDLSFSDPISLIYPDTLSGIPDLREDRGLHVTLDRGRKCKAGGLPDAAWE